MGPDRPRASMSLRDGKGEGEKPVKGCGGVGDWRVREEVIRGNPWNLRPQQGGGGER